MKEKHLEQANVNYVLIVDNGSVFLITNQKAPVILKGLSSPERRQVYREGSRYELKEAETVRNVRIIPQSNVSKINTLSKTSHKSVEYGNNAGHLLLMDTPQV